MAEALSSLSNLLSSLLPPQSPPLSLRSLSSPTSLHLPKPTSKWDPIVATVCPTPSISSFPPTTTNIRIRVGDDNNVSAMLYPSLAYSNTLYFKSAYNVQIIVEENESEEKLAGRFRRAVSRAGIINECRRRRFFENSRDKRKRKSREAALKNRKRRPRPRTAPQAKQESPMRKKDEEDNWELPEGDLPF
ncbi:Ribosomal_S21 domain-containing protein [Cephalotus follicularis]|uniref:Ribosomal_S21 domain-containing protein n=1 Tax=Cephalotus follicularis TaxID=3775 RepID=A0A1Q3BJJ9_CEPFO|nr:Ribosomal_S21 domain-containing protein [Cephalotus follicularis]